MGLSSRLLHCHRDHGNRKKATPGQQSPLFGAGTQSTPDLVRLGPTSPPHSATTGTNISIPPPPPHPCHSTVTKTATNSSTLPPTLGLNAGPAACPPITNDALTPCRSVPRSCLRDDRTLLNTIPPPRFTPSFRRRTCFRTRRQPSLVRRLSAPLNLKTVLLLLINDTKLNCLIASPATMRRLHGRT